MPSRSRWRFAPAWPLPRARISASRSIPPISRPGTSASCPTGCLSTGLEQGDRRKRGHERGDTAESAHAEPRRVNRAVPGEALTANSASSSSIDIVPSAGREDRKVVGLLDLRGQVLQSGFAPVSRTTLPHLSSSALTYSAVCCCEPPTSSNACASSRSRTSAL
jgi:hypothetical protein